MEILAEIVMEIPMEIPITAEAKDIIEGRSMLRCLQHDADNVKFSFLGTLDRFRAALRDGIKNTE